MAELHVYDFDGTVQVGRHKRRHAPPRDPLILNVGSEGGVKVGEGNHRLAIARELGIRKVPVEFQFKTYRVRKRKQFESTPVEVSPKAIKNVVEEAVEEAERKPPTPEEQKDLDRLMELIFRRK